MRINPSILAADFANLAHEISRIPNADAVHVDVMDNHFVPNLTFGHQMVKRLAEISATPLDVHLMIENVDFEAPRFAALGAQSVTFHIEASQNPHGTVAAIRAEGAKAAMAIRPSTDLAEIEQYLRVPDMILIMTVEPGFGGQKLITAMVDRVREVRRILSETGSHLRVQVDGGVDASNIGILADAGADVFVAGSSVFGTPNPSQAIDLLKAQARRVP